MKRIPKVAYTLEFKLEALRRARGGEPVRKIGHCRDHDPRHPFANRSAITGEPRSRQRNLPWIIRAVVFPNMPNNIVNCHIYVVASARAAHYNMPRNSTGLKAGHFGPRADDERALLLPERPHWAPGRVPYAVA